MGREKASRSQRASRSSGDSARLNSLAKNIRKGLEEEQKRQLNTIATSLNQLLNIQKKQAEKICDIEQSRAPEPSDSDRERPNPVPERSSDNGRVSCESGNPDDPHDSDGSDGDSLSESDDECHIWHLRQALLGKETGKGAL